MRQLINTSLHDITPSSIKDDSDIYAIIEALDPELKLITSSVQEEYILSRIDELDEQVLNYLAWQFHVDFYDLAPDLSKKREQVKDSIKWHMKKGTAWAIIKALDMIGIDAEFINWYESGGAPYTFKIKASIRKDYYLYSDKEKIAENIRRVILEAKAARSLLAELDAKILDLAEVRLNAGIAQGRSGSSRINLHTPEPPEDTYIKSAIAQGESGNEIIKLSRPLNNNETKIYAATVRQESRSISLGLEEKIVQELLQAFEDRIYSKLEAHQEKITQEINTRYNEIEPKLLEIRDLLLWNE